MYYSTDVEPDEDCDSDRDAEAALREQRPSSSNKDQLLELMKRTRNVHRSWIVTKHPTITDIAKRYPRLMDMPDAVS